MERYDAIYRLYREFPADTLRAYQDFVELFPPIDSRVALEHWQRASEELEERKDAIRSAFDDGGTFAEIAAHATREQAFTALDLASTYGRGVNVLVLDVDETLRSAGGTDNEIPRETLALLTAFHEDGVPIVICTGQTLENVKGFTIQGLGSEVVHSGRLSIVYEAGTGVFTPNQGAETKRLLYDGLDEGIVSIFDRLRSRVLREAPEELRRGCHLQGNEFNVTMKPNFETGSSKAVELIDDALAYEIDLLADAIAEEVDADADADRVRDWTRAFYAADDPEIRTVLERVDAEAGTDADPEEAPAAIRAILERIDVAYYEGDAAEIGSRELNKVVGVESALGVLGVEEPFALVMGDSKSDLRVMRWAADGRGIAAAPEHASQDVLEHVLETDELLFDRGRSADMLRTIYALNRLVAIAD
jgi:hydroxymethylpyrimidine pyrophosphatase-like HAD family hydrolase